MKTLLTLSLALVGFLGIGVSEAQAQRGYVQNSSVFISGYLGCGTPIYSQRVFRGYDNWGQQIWVVQRVNQFQRCGVVRPNRFVRRGYNRNACRPVNRVRRGRVNHRNNRRVVRNGQRQRRGRR